MQRVLIGLSALSLMFLGTQIDISACGDKLLVLGHGVRSQMFRTAVNPASILIYAKSENSQNLFKRSNLQATLKKAGHKVWFVKGPGELQQALQSRQYDLILTDLADARMLEQHLQSLPSLLPGIVPVVDGHSSRRPHRPRTFTAKF